MGRRAKGIAAACAMAAAAVAAGVLSFGQGMGPRFDEPAPEDSRVVDDSLVEVTPLSAEEYVALMADRFGRVEQEWAKRNIVEEALEEESAGSGELMDALVERYGAAEVEKYAPEAAAEAAGGE